MAGKDGLTNWEIEADVPDGAEHVGSADHGSNNGEPLAQFDPEIRGLVAAISDPAWSRAVSVIDSADTDPDNPDLMAQLLTVYFDGVFAKGPEEAGSFEEEFLSRLKGKNQQVYRSFLIARVEAEDEHDQSRVDDLRNLVKGMEADFDDWRGDAFNGFSDQVGF